MDLILIAVEFFIIHIYSFPYLQQIDRLGQG